MILAALLALILLVPVVFRATAVPWQPGTPFYVQIGNEQILVTSTHNGSTTWATTRGSIEVTDSRDFPQPRGGFVRYHWFWR